MCIAEGRTYREGIGVGSPLIRGLGVLLLFHRDLSTHDGCTAAKHFRCLLPSVTSVAFTTECNLCKGMHNMKPKVILQASILISAAASLALSISLYFAGNDESDKLNGIYVGVWVPSILALGAFLLAGRKDA